MISDEAEELACLYALGALGGDESQSFERRLEGDPALRRHVDELVEIAASLAVASVPRVPAPPYVKVRLFDRIAPPADDFSVVEAMLHATKDPVVVTDRHGVIEWVNPAFEVMCGYTVDEVRGHRPGAMLQGRQTDPATVARMRAAIREARPCCEEVVNYRKNGEPYWVSVSITPVLDPEHAPRCFIAIERELPDRLVAA